MKIFEEWYEKSKRQLLDDFFTFLRFPSISTDPVHKKDMDNCSEWVQHYMKESGLEVEVWKTKGHDIVFGQWLKGGKEAPTLLFYGHYDVQPTVPLNEWHSPPFEPEIREGKVYARGAIDNKGQGFYTLLAIRAFLKQMPKARVNIKVLIEGEEEIGSPSLEAIAEKKRQALQADHVFIVDLDMYDQGVPAVTLGTRGVAAINATVKNINIDLHSGTFGGIVLNPARALTAVIGKMWNERGEVNIPGFYKGVKTFSKEEKSCFDWDIDAQKEEHEFSIKVFQGEGDFSLLESNWIRPTLEINGMESGYTGKGFKTIIPKEASVKFSCRLVPGQDPDEILDLVATFLKNNLPQGIELTLEKGHGTPSMMTSPDSETVKGAMKAYERVFNTRCKRQLCGATIPIAPTLAKICQGNIVLIGVGLATDGMHAPNECFGLDRLKLGFLSITELLEIFSSGGLNGSI